MTFQKEEAHELETEIFKKGFACLAAVFPAVPIQPDFYYELLKDLREDYFIWAITKICREQVELYPNTNIVALIRSHEEQFKFEKNRRKEERKAIRAVEPDYDSEETKKAVEEFRKMRDKIAGKMDVSNGTDKRNIA